jgi:hypothetical protein
MLPTCMRDDGSCTALFFLVRAESGMILSARLNVAKMCENGLLRRFQTLLVCAHSRLEEFCATCGNHLFHPPAAPFRRWTGVTVIVHSAHRYMESGQTCLACDAKVAFLSEFNFSMSLIGQLC